MTIATPYGLLPYNITGPEPNATLVGIHRHGTQRDLAVVGYEDTTAMANGIT